MTGSFYCPRTGQRYSDAPDAASPCDESGDCRGCAYWSSVEADAESAAYDAAEAEAMERGL